MSTIGRAVRLLISTPRQAKRLPIDKRFSAQLFAFLESCESTPILSTASLSIQKIGFLVLVVSFSGCWREPKERTYDAPKIESEFVKGREPQPRRAMPPMMGSGRIPLEDRRILGAVIPDGANVYFVKATDRIEQIASAVSAFRSVVEQFAIDSGTGSPKLELPQGWTLKLLDNANAGIGLAEMIAEINFDAAEGRIRFTVSKYERPREQAMWDEYLLSQINRWRGQLELAPITISELQKELPTIPRQGEPLPAYLFDAQGGVGGVSPAIPKSPSEPNRQADVQPSPSPAIPSLKLVYDKPDGWELQPARPYREATFKFIKDAKVGEVTVSTAKDSPVQNAAMWISQVLPNNEPAALESLAVKTVDEAESFQAGEKTGKLYSIRASDQPEARSLLVVAIPMGNDGMSMFVKLNCELRMMEEEKSTFLSFVNSLRWE